MPVTTDNYTITWEKLPDDFVLDDSPGDNIDQPLLAAALRESLEITGLLREGVLVATNFGLCATLNGKLVIKAPDWVYVRAVQLEASREIRRSYTPHLSGEIPAIVMEFLSDTGGEVYSIKRTYPPGKWFFYEQILRVPNYAIFEPVTGLLEVYRLDDRGQYDLQPPDANGRYWISGIELFLGVWQGTKAERTGHWLRWWNESGQMLPWGAELVQQERQRAEEERQRAEEERLRAEEERLRAERLAEQLRQAGIEPEV